MAGSPISPGVHKDGISYFDSLLGNGEQRPPMFWHSPISRPNSTGDRMSSAVIDGDWKLIHWFNDGLFELFNLKEDKAEQYNLAAKYPEKVKALKSSLDVG